MFEDLKIQFKQNGIVTTLEVDDEYEDNLPFNLAQLFETVIRASNANPRIVIEELKSAFEYDADNLQ